MRLMGVSVLGRSLQYTMQREESELIEGSGQWVYLEKAIAIEVFAIAYCVQMT